ncbi:hypothetical protein EMCRGX_G005275 [Ephydatia muelleri]
MQSEARDELEGDSISVSTLGVQLVSEGSEGPDSRFEVQVFLVSDALLIEVSETHPLGSLATSELNASELDELSQLFLTYPSARQSAGGNPHWGHSYLQIPREQTIFSTSPLSIIDSPRLNTSHPPSTCTYPNRGNQLPMRGGTLSTHAILQERGTLTYPIAPR